jgi:hypothetical protein
MKPRPVIMIKAYGGTAALSVKQGQREKTATKT